MKVLIVIPARYASTRFPGKPLALIHGKPMIQLVWEQAMKVKGDTTVVVATDHQGIQNTVEGFGGQCVRTRSDHPSGTDRCAEAAGILDFEGDVVLNMQGDEPFINPSALERLIDVFADRQVQLATLCRRIDAKTTLEDPNVVKVVKGIHENALYFSRFPVPFLRNYHVDDWIAQNSHFQHIGVYAFRPEVLQAVTSLAPTQLEKAESLEQLRWLEYGHAIRLVETNYVSKGIDTPEDLNGL
ncbi:MAG TPA: 3-deoxy-manno-octulosonate cytidylyltransferase [Bacteroidetes bacterium]|jgi:3-deoxy-manno-octulosonate cytidylyltransferase (CMP-KDO synthetase)|nr:3-deoxy-manno-octulosonate cytidylyltransferase [Bacteroidota bacterium]